MYQIEITMKWGDPRIPILYPKDAHTGNMFLVVHNDQFKLFQEGQYASDGIVETSEYGTTTGLEKEAQESGNVEKYYLDDVLQCPGKKTFFIKATPQDQISFATMLAPSQCNFTGFSNLHLANLERASFPIHAYSAGADVDDVFVTKPKKPLSVRKPISLKTDLPFFMPEYGQRAEAVGCVTVSKVADE